MQLWCRFRTSYTHSAVDNVLLRLLSAGLQCEQVGRLGSFQNVHPETRSFIFDPHQNQSIAAIGPLLKSMRVIACTVLTASRHALLKACHIDVCVIDEAGQIPQPVTLGAVLKASTAVLVGDDYQVNFFPYSLITRSLIIIRSSTLWF